jgi:Tfp pilus assembly protein PilF
MIRALSQLKQGKDAAALLASIPADALPASQVNLMRGMVAVSSGNWPEARKALDAVLQQMPDSAEAHFLMGQVYEAENNWQKAAQEYRASRLAPAK